MVNAIPFEKLEEGLQIIKRNVESLIETATLLNQNKKFLHSAIFSMFAIEEMAKAQVLQVYNSHGKDIPYAEWDRIVKGKAHYTKWKGYLQKVPVNAEVEKKNRALYPEVTKDLIIELLANYHLRLKNNVLYVNWDKRLNHWYWLPDDYSEKDKEERSTSLLNAAKSGFLRVDWSNEKHG